MTFMTSEFRCASSSLDLPRSKGARRRGGRLGKPSLLYIASYPVPLIDLFPSPRTKVGMEIIIGTVYAAKLYTVKTCHSLAIDLWSS